MKRLWAAWVGAGVALELYGLTDRTSDDTLSEQVWDLIRGRGGLRAVGIAVSGWLVWHFFGRAS